MQIPTLMDLTSGKERIDFLNEIEIDDLLGREIVQADLDFQRKNLILENLKF